MPFVDFLRTAVLLFAAAATVLAIVALAGASAQEDTALIYIAAGWWTAAAAVGVWLGRRPEATLGIARLMSSARGASSLPEVEPGRILVDRLWWLAAFTVVAGGVAFLLPQVPAMGAGYALLWALYWRRQEAAVSAIEERDGVRFYVERVSPTRATRLLRTPGFRRLEPTARPAREPESAPSPTPQRMSACAAADELLRRGGRALAQGVELRPAVGVRHVARAEPRPPGGGHAVADIRERLRPMGVRVDDQLDPGLDGPTGIRVR